MNYPDINSNQYQNLNKTLITLYKNHKYKYLELNIKGGGNKNSDGYSLNLSDHSKISFLDKNAKTNFKFGKKEVSALFLPHAGSTYVRSILDYIFSDIDITNFDNVLLLTTNHSSKHNYQSSFDTIKFNDITIKLKQIQSNNSISINNDFF